MKSSFKFLSACVILIILAFAACEKMDLMSPSSPAPTEKKRPTAPTTSSWAEVVTSNINMHIIADTTHCGTLVLHWDAQPNCNKYYIFDMNQPTSCWPSNTSTNVWYYQYGWGCNFNASSSVNAMVQGEYADSSTMTLYKYQSVVQTIQTGRGQWNCN